MWDVLVTSVRSLGQGCVSANKAFQIAVGFPGAEQPAGWSFLASGSSQLEVSTVYEFSQCPRSASEAPRLGKALVSLPLPGIRKRGRGKRKRRRRKTRRRRHFL